jgi:hypothetical protein
MDLALLAGGAFAVTVLVLADRVDAIVDALYSPDDPLTNFEANLDDDDTYDADESADLNEDV